MIRALCLALAGGLTAVALPLGAQPLSRFSEQKAEVLLREKLPCLGCHQFRSEGGRLAPDLATVRARRSADYVAAMVADPQRVRPGSMMPKHPMPAAQQQLIVRYLATRPGNATEGAPATPPAANEDRSAAALYARFCAGCHGATGGGDGPNAPFLPVRPAVHRSAPAMSPRPDDALFDAIAAGGEIMNRSPRMPAFGQMLSPDEVRSLVRYIRSLCGCEGPRWSSDQRRE